MNGFEPPAFVANDPQGTFYWYVSNGMPYQEAANLVAQRFGQPKTREQLAREQERAKNQSDLAQIGGSLGGIALGREAFKGFPNVKGWLGSESAPPDIGSGSAGMTRPVPPPTTSIDGSGAGAIDLGGGTSGATVATPKVLEVKGTTATIETPAGVEQVPTEALNDPGFFSNIDWNKAAQGGMGALQLYQAYKSFKEGDKLGAGIYGTAGATNIAASGFAGQMAQQAASEALGGYLIPGVNIATGLYSGYKTADAIGDMAAGNDRYKTGAMGMAATGAALGSVIPGVGTAVGAVVGAVAGLAAAKFGSSKNQAQMLRDGIRDVWQENGIIDENYKGTLADGSVFDFGVDGSKLKWSEIDKIAEAKPEAWSAAVGLLDPLVSSFGLQGQKGSDVVAWLARAAVSNAGNDPQIAIDNVKHMAAQQGLDADAYQKIMDTFLAEDKITQQEYDNNMSHASRLFGEVTPELSQELTERPAKGEVARLSPGMYRDASGNLVKADSMRAALEKAYKGKKKDKEL